MISYVTEKSAAPETISADNGIRFLSDADTRVVLAWPDVIACLIAAYERYDQPESAPPRVVARNDGMWLRAMAAIPAGGNCMGTKIIAKARIKGSSHMIALWAQETAELVCLIDGKHVTAMRTAGTSAVAVDRLAPRGVLRVAVLGSGAEASAHVSAISTLRRFSSLVVYSPTPANREAFARRYAQELDIECRSADSARDAVAGADLVIAAARSRDETPILEGAWLAPGMTVVSIGSTLPEQREVDPGVIQRADLIIADVPEEVVAETGDMIAARNAGIKFEGKMASLAELVHGRCPARCAGDIALFKSIGSSLQDIAVSELCYVRARQRGIGTVLPVAIGARGGQKK